jgi:hypothetical protein
VHTGTQSATLATAGLKASTSLQTDSTQHNIIWASLTDGTAQAFDIRSHISAQVIPPESIVCGPLDALAIDSKGSLILGGSRGVCGIYDPRAAALRVRWTRSSASIEAIATLPGDRALISGEDGLPYTVEYGDGDLHVREELVFGDVETARCVRVRGSEAWLAGDGGVVRRYSI